MRLDLGRPNSKRNEKEIYNIYIYTTIFQRTMKFLQGRQSKTLSEYEVQSFKYDRSFKASENGKACIKEWYTLDLMFTFKNE